MSLARRLKIAGVVLLIGGAGYYAYRTQYAGPREKLLASLAEINADINRLDEGMRDQFEVRKRLKAFGVTTLGQKRDEVEHWFRTSLSTIAEGNGLGQVVVDTGAPQGVRNPAWRSKSLPTSTKRQLAGRPDFQQVLGQVKGVGTLEQVMRTVAAVQAQSWVHRFEGFSITPAGKERDRFTLKLEVATIMTPDLAVETKSPPPIVAADRGADRLWGPVVAKNVFREPAPGAASPVTVAAAPQVGAAPAALTSPPAYGDWLLTGVVTGRTGTEAFMRNTKTSEKVTVAIGAAVLDARFLAGDVDRAVFEIAGKRFEIRNGETLASRRQLN
ncbi:MAG: hypothetical protein IT436_05545 [Phycisphaerales bacterium]|nr:hypothetical protein [Phycisphaerales bacterium]